MPSPRRILYATRKVKRCKIADAVFSNYAILKKLFGKVGMPVQEVLKCRLLNKHCNFAACDMLNRTHRAPAKSFCNAEDLDQFLNTIRDRLEATIPYGKFAFELHFIPMTLLLRFIQEAGQYMRDFEIFTSPTQFAESATTDEMLTTKIALLFSNPSTLDTVTLFLDDFALTQDELDGMPKSFPQLRSLYGQQLLAESSPESFFKTVIGRSPRFEYLALDSARVATLPAILLEPNRVLTPYSTLDLTFVDGSVPVLEEMCRQKYNQVRTLTAKVQFQAASQAYKLTSIFSEFLALQADSLKRLTVQAFFPELNFDPGKFLLKTLNKLETLRLGNFNDAWLPNSSSGNFGIPLVEPFVSGQFPNLTKLELVKLPADQALFDSRLELPSVRELKIMRIDAAPEDLFFQRNFPNLAILSVKCFPKMNVLRYILSDLTELLELSLGMNMTPINEEEQRWDMFTGGAQKLSMEEMFQNLWPDEAVLINQEPTPSLANFTKLVRFSTSISTGLELQALAFMSRSGKMPVLDHLEITYCPGLPFYVPYALAEVIPGSCSCGTNCIFNATCSSILMGYHKHVRFNKLVPNPDMVTVTLIRMEMEIEG